MPRGDSLARQLQLMQILEQRHEVAVPDVAAELGYTQRTVYRDLAVLERVGVPIYQDRRGQRARWRVVDGYRRRLSLTLSRTEVLALTLGRKLLGGLSGTVLDEFAGSALQKIRAALPQELIPRVECAEAVLSGGGPLIAYSTNTAAQHVITDAIQRQETVRLLYRKPCGRRVVERLVDPYLLHVQEGAVYLIGHCHLRNESRTFRLDRVRSATGTGTIFGARARPLPSAILQGAFGPWEGRPVRISLRFAPAAARFVTERRMHPSQCSQLLSDGGLDLKFRMPICPELLRWLLGWGADVQVLAPANLAQRLHGERIQAASSGAREDGRLEPERAAARASRGVGAGCRTKLPTVLDSADPSMLSRLERNNRTK